jgi:hypothetical protein
MPPKRFVVTTHSSHKLLVYLNFAGLRKLTGSNQQCEAGIPYLQVMWWEFVYLAVAPPDHFDATIWFGGHDRALHVLCLSGR